MGMRREKWAFQSEGAPMGISLAHGGETTEVASLMGLEDQCREVEKPSQMGGESDYQGILKS